MLDKDEFPVICTGTCRWRCFSSLPHDRYQAAHDMFSDDPEAEPISGDDLIIPIAPFHRLNVPMRSNPAEVSDKRGHVGGVRE